jgi:hypothetical protein
VGTTRLVTLAALCLAACAGAPPGERTLDFRAEVHLPDGVTALEVDGQPVAATSGVVVIERDVHVGFDAPLSLRLDEPPVRARLEPGACASICRQHRPPGANCRADFDRERVVVRIGADGVVQTIAYGCSSPRSGAFSFEVK